MRYAAWIPLKAGDLHNCMLFDNSETGARIDIVDSKIAPDRFSLFLSTTAPRLHRGLAQATPNRCLVLAAACPAKLLPNLDGAQAAPLAPQQAETEPAENA